MDQRVNLLEALRTIVVNRRVVVWSVVVAALAAVAVSLALPRWYAAVVTILPPESDLNQSNMTAMMRLAGYKPGMIPTAVGQADVYAAILSSETVVDAVIDSLDLMQVYKAKGLLGARDRVYENLNVSVTPDGLVRVVYQDRDPDRAIAVANEFVRRLDWFSRETLMTSGRRVRKFVEGRLAETSAELTKAQDALKDFKEATGAVLITEQATASIKAAAEIYGKIAELEVALERVRQYATERSPEVVDLRSQIRALDRKLAEMGYTGGDATGGATAGGEEPGGIPGGAGPDELRLFPSFRTAPELEQRLSDLEMQVEVKRAVYGALAEQYEQARISETRDTPTIQVLDWAKGPLIRSKPKRKVIVLVTTVAALVLASFGVLVRERLRSGGASREREALRDIRDLLASDLRAARSAFGNQGKPTGS